eukprot:Clim_evm48s148 gene=Clim_evmTU48s148
MWWTQGKDTFCGPYRVEKAIGKGSFAEVRTGSHISTHEKVALKLVDKGMISGTDEKSQRRRRYLQREIRYWKLLHHPNICRLYEVIETEENIVLIMEYMSGGELSAWVRKHGALKEKHARRYFRQIISAMDYLHKNQIVHRDIKPSNMIFDDERKNLKIIDFGFTNAFNPDDTLNSFIGSPSYAAPELVEGKAYAGPPADIWSLGCALYFILTGTVAFVAPNLEQLFDRIVNVPLQYPAHVSREARSLIDGMLAKKVKHRMTMEQIRHHEWMVMGFNSPPYDYVIPRNTVIESIDDDLVEEIKLFGHTEEDIREALSKEDTSYIKTVYCLLLERKLRDAQLALTQQNAPEEKEGIKKEKRLSRLLGGLKKKNSGVTDKRRSIDTYYNVSENDYKKRYSIPLMMEATDPNAGKRGEKRRSHQSSTQSNGASPQPGSKSTTPQPSLAVPGAPEIPPSPKSMSSPLNTSNIPSELDVDVEAEIAEALGTNKKESDAKSEEQGHKKDSGDVDTEAMSNKKDSGEVDTEAAGNKKNGDSTEGEQLDDKKNGVGTDAEPLDDKDDAGVAGGENVKEAGGKNGSVTKGSTASSVTSDMFLGVGNTTPNVPGSPISTSDGADPAGTFTPNRPASPAMPPIQAIPESVANSKVRALDTDDLCTLDDLEKRIQGMMKG